MPGEGKVGGGARTAGELEWMCCLLLDEQRQGRRAAFLLTVTATAAVICVWAGVSSPSPGARCLFAVILVLNAVAAVTLIRRLRLAYVCLKSYRWHVEWLKGTEQQRRS
ncbi:hypothetical protein QIS99_28110 [Streptomyces sp. B-S-A8]|uniref:PGG domain-containing protein n=1 Tax=Streptomyces solicavernae TaxID=3043614 RepID=A0ABT6S015_9ACTN|nr:hypothetical protein [Streptomyces sp. B-S-A8]MDI3390027.1 hypothetical protein [Streptomyces sp. B-S-A8]